MKTDTGTHLSPVYNITRGLPQGGVISPLLWIVFFNPIIEKLRQMREETGENQENYKDLIYADDITCIIQAENKELLQYRAHKLVAMVRSIMREMSLQLNEQKTVNLILSPHFLPRGIYRGEQGGETITAKKRKRKLRKL